MEWHTQFSFSFLLEGTFVVQDDDDDTCCICVCTSFSKKEKWKIHNQRNVLLYTSLFFEQSGKKEILILFLSSYLFSLLFPSYYYFAYITTLTNTMEESSGKKEKCGKRDNEFSLVYFIFPLFCVGFSLHSASSHKHTKIVWREKTKKQLLVSFPLSPFYLTRFISLFV